MSGTARGAGDPSPGALPPGGHFSLAGQMCKQLFHNVIRCPVIGGYTTEERVVNSGGSDTKRVRMSSVLRKRACQVQ